MRRLPIGSLIQPLVFSSAAAFLLAGCFDTHGRGGGDAGPEGDGGVIRACSLARFAPEGAPCDFAGSCDGGLGECGPPTTIQCVEGRIRVLHPICIRAFPRNCEEYLRWGAPGDFCIEDDFTGCTLDESGCCSRRIDCVGNSVIDETVCGDCEPRSCPGYMPPPPVYPSCRSGSDCDESVGGCTPAGTPHACGVCREPVTDCLTDADCAIGDLCIEEEGAPCGCRGPDRVCAPDCRVVDDACGPDEICDVAGRCRAPSCTDGFACPSNMRCEREGGDAHGCARVGCTVDSDCDCGLCMDGVCQDGPGECRPPVA